MDRQAVIRVGLVTSDDISCSKRDLKRRSTLGKDDKDTQIQIFMEQRQTLHCCWEKPLEQFQEVSSHGLIMYM